MSNNTLTVPQMVAAEAQRIAHEKAIFVGTINREYDDSYAKTGAKIGDTLKVRQPNQYTVSTSSRVMDVQDQDESTISVVMASQYHVDMRFNSAELALSIDQLSKRYIEPAVSVLVSKIDGECLQTATQETFNVAGTAGTVPGTVTSGFSDTSALGKARAKVNQGLAPLDDRVGMFDSVTMASITNGIKVMNNPSGDVSKAWREGFVGRAAGLDLYENERGWSMTNGDDVAGLIDESSATNFVQGATTLHIDTLGTGSITKGQVFEIDGIYACHPETKAAYPHKQQFVVTSTVALGSNEADITFTPAIYTTGAKKNVCTSTGADVTWTYSAQNDVVVTFFGSASTTYKQNLVYHKDAFTFVTADLPLMGGADKCARITKDGISLRVWQDGDIRNDELLMRIDILWGFKTMRPYWASRVTN
mgnify:CR=1 FL=1